jgi:hypothetical protein
MYLKIWYHCHFVCQTLVSIIRASHHCAIYGGQSGNVTVFAYSISILPSVIIHQWPYSPSFICRRRCVTHVLTASLNKPRRSVYRPPTSFFASLLIILRCYGTYFGKAAIQYQLSSPTDITVQWFPLLVCIRETLVGFSSSKPASKLRFLIFLHQFRHYAIY